MKSFRKNIIKQIEEIPKGRIFTSKNLSFEPNKRANVAVILSELTKNSVLVRIERGTYYKPTPSLLGLKHRPVQYQEKLDFITEKLNGYITGPYIFNQMNLTEQVSMVITVATPKPIRKFKTMNVRVECVKSYVDKINLEDLYYLRLLDAIKYIRNIPGTKPSDVYSRLINYHFNNIQLKDLRKINKLAEKYPPRVRRILIDINRDLGYQVESMELSNTINSNTRFKTIINN